MYLDGLPGSYVDAVDLERLVCYQQELAITGAAICLWKETRVSVLVRRNSGRTKDVTISPSGLLNAINVFFLLHPIWCSIAVVASVIPSQ